MGFLNVTPIKSIAINLIYVIFCLWYVELEENGEDKIVRESNKFLKI